MRSWTLALPPGLSGVPASGSVPGGGATGSSTKREEPGVVPGGTTTSKAPPQDASTVKVSPGWLLSGMATSTVSTGASLSGLSVGWLAS